KRLIAVVYTLVIKGTRSGKRSLIIPGSKTFAIAISIPIKIVPINNSGTNGMDLTIKPITSSTIPTINVVSFVYFILILGTKGDIFPKDIKMSLFKISNLTIDIELLSITWTKISKTQVTFV